MEIKSTELKKDKKKTISINLMKYIIYQVSGRCSNYGRVEKVNVWNVPITTTEDCRNIIQVPNNIPKSLDCEGLHIIKIRYVLKIYVNKEKFKLPIIIS